MKSPHLTLYLPQPQKTLPSQSGKKRLSWFLDFFYKHTLAQTSIASYLIELVVKDLKDKNLVTEEEFNQWSKAAEDKKRTRAVVRKSKRRKEKKRTLCVYIPRTLTWLPEKLEAFDNKGNYILDLLVKKHKSLLSQEQKLEWREYCSYHRRVLEDR